MSTADREAEKRVISYLKRQRMDNWSVVSTGKELGVRLIGLIIVFYSTVALKLLVH